MYDRVKIASKKPKAERFKTAQTQKNKFNNHSSPLDQILFLQRTIGNQVVERLIRNVHSPLSVVREQIQAKLKIGQPNDIYEQEADRVAEQIVSSYWSVVNNQMEEGEIQRQTEEEERKREEEETLQLKEMQGNIPEVTPDLESRIRALRGGGQPLPKSIRAFFEPRFGYDFSHVHIHTDPEAARLARVLNAEAFTYGRDIYFGEGRYNPGTLTGKRLLAHELVHVVQQKSAINSYPIILQCKEKRREPKKSQEIIFEEEEAGVVYGKKEIPFQEWLKSPKGCKFLNCKNKLQIVGYEFEDMDFGEYGEIPGWRIKPPPEWKEYSTYTPYTKALEICEDLLKSKPFFRYALQKALKLLEQKTKEPYECAPCMLQKVLSGGKTDFLSGGQVRYWAQEPPSVDLWEIVADKAEKVLEKHYNSALDMDSFVDRILNLDENIRSGINQVHLLYNILPSDFYDSGFYDETIKYLHSEMMKRQNDPNHIYYCYRT